MGKDRIIEHKSFVIDIKSIDEEKGIFEGYGAVFGNVDNWLDKIEKGAFTKTLKEKKTFPLLWQHDTAQPIGIFSAKQDEKGLYIKAELNMEVSKSREALSLLKQKAINGLSIGFSTIKYEFENVKNLTVRLLKEIKLFETSIVTFPANELATVTDIKSSNDIFKYIIENKDKDGFKEKIISLLEAKEPDNTAHEDSKKSIDFNYILENLKK